MVFKVDRLIVPKGKAPPWDRVWCSDGNFPDQLRVQSFSTPLLHNVGLVDLCASLRQYFASGG